MRVKWLTIPKPGKMFFLPVGFVLVLLICGAGCVVIPVPPSESGRTRSHLDPQVLKEFAPGKTTFTEVTNRLGVPDAISPDERQVAYRTEKITGTRLSLIPGQDGGPDPVYTDRVYFFEFNEQGLLKDTRQTVQKNLTTEWPEHTPQMSEQYRPLVQSEDAAYVPAGESVWRVHDQCDWLPGETGSKGLATPQATAIPGRLFITESNLYFYSATRLANAGPSCKVPFNSITGIHAPVDNLGHRAGLVVLTKTGAPNAFIIYLYNNGSPNSAAVTADLEFIQSKMEPATSEK